MSPTLPSSPNGTPNRRPGSRVGCRTAFALAVALLMVGSSLFAFGGALAGASTPAGPTPTTASHARGTTASAAASPGIASGPTLRPQPAGPPPATGRGTFFSSANLSQATAGNQSCQATSAPTPLCMNTTFNPSINITAAGLLGVAYTADTNYSHCAGPATVGNASYSVNNNTTMDVAFQSSSNGGTTWSTPVYLGNENCGQALNLSDAWDPSLTSLPNGTFVVTYTEFSSYVCPYSYCDREVAPNIPPPDMLTDALVVQRSFDGGVSWTAPQVLNTSVNPAPDVYCGPNTYPAYRPWISSSGASVYIVWENFTQYESCYGGGSSYSAGVHLVSSADGGATWDNATPVNFPTLGAGPNSTFYSPTNYSTNPTVLATPNGQVYVAYATGLQELSHVCEPSGCMPYDIWTEDVVVANATASSAVNSTGNASGNWTIHVAGRDIPNEFQEGASGNYYGPYSDVAPQLAYDSVDHELYVAYSSVAIGTFCYTYIGLSQPYCYANDSQVAAYFQNSSTNGVSWSPPAEIGNAVNPYGGFEDTEYYPTIAVDHNGTVEAMVDFYNETDCVYVLGYLDCGVYEQLEFNSTDFGRNWSAPVLISPFVVTRQTDAYEGEYETAAVAPSGAVYLAWTNSVCQSTTTYCYYDDPYYGVPPTTNITVSWLFQGPGVTLTFHESNLTALGNWSVELMGNQRQAVAGTNLAVSGIPSGSPVEWSVPWQNYTYGLAWEPVGAAGNAVSPGAFATNTTLQYTFQEQVLLHVFLNPPIDPYYVTPGYLEATYSMAPLPGAYWLPVNSSQTFSVLPQPISCTLYCNYQNLSWQSWTGTGPGSVNSNATTVTATIGGSPVNETANFLDLGECYGSSGSLTCSTYSGYPLNFTESGLPAGTPWGVTAVLNSSANGTVVATSNSTTINVTTGQSIVSFLVWTVPATGGLYWIPSTDPGSPVREPTETSVAVDFTLGSPSNYGFSANLTAVGLPNSTSWSATVGTTSYAVTTGNLTVEVAGGVPTDLTGLPVYTDQGVGYYASSISVYPYVANTTWTNASVLPATFTFDGSARVVVQYSPMFWLTVSASGGGTVSPASEWVPLGASVNLTAIPSPGYHFLDWTGVGSGSSTVAESHNETVTIQPGSPVNELATFRLIPPPTWNVTVVAGGLPAGTSFGFTLGNGTFSTTAASTTIGGLVAGSYQFRTEDVYSTTFNGTRWVPTSWSSTFASGGGGVLSIVANGSIWVNYTTEYVLGITSTPDGEVTPGVGLNWTDAGTNVTLTATAAYHYKFVGWNGTGAGSVTTSEPTAALTMTGPISEAAAFDYRIFPTPAVFRETVQETGLPSLVSWNVSVSSGNASAAGTASSLNLTGLNGTYTLVVPAVYVGLGTRYVANTSTPVSVTENGSTTVAFTEEFAYTVSASAGGTVSGAGSVWVAKGTTETLSATPATGYMFLSWNGTGSGGAMPYNGTSATGQSITVNGPTNETATFAPVVPTTTTGSSSAGMAPAIGLLVLLLVVGLVVGLILGTRRPRPPAVAASSEPDANGGAGDGAGAADTFGSAPMVPGPATDGAADYDESRLP